MPTIEIGLLAVIAGSAVVTAVLQVIKHYGIERVKFRKVRVHRMPIKEPFEAEWMIKFYSLNKDIPNCNVSFGGELLKWKEGGPDKFLEAGKHHTIWIPKGMERDDAEVKVQDSSKVYYCNVFGKIPKAG